MPAAGPRLRGLRKGHAALDDQSAFIASLGSSYADPRLGHHRGGVLFRR